MYGAVGGGASSVSTPPAAHPPLAPPRALRWTIVPSSASAEVVAVWATASERNPFASPAFLRLMQELTPDRTVVAVGRDAGGAPAAVWPMRVTEAGTIHFLSRGYSDQSGCLTLPGIGESTLAGGLVAAIHESGARRIEMTNISPWGPTHGAVRQAIAMLGWHGRTFPAWPCPVLSVPPGPSAGAELRQSIEQHKRLRGYANALRREDGYAFEVLDDDADLDAWTSEFRAAHEARWNATDTPSRYAEPGEAERLRAVLGAWTADRLLTRFAIRVGGRRVAFAACLRNGGRLIYYLVVASPAAERGRAGHVLIRLIGLWMSERGFDTLDFGAGGEEYKYRYANVEHRLWRVFAASSRLSSTYVRGVLEARIRSSPALQRQWDRAMSGRIVGQARRAMSVALGVIAQGATVDGSALG